MDIRVAHAFYVDLFAQHNVTDWKIRWNRRQGTAGETVYSKKTVTFSARAVQIYSDEDVINLGKHELAHILVGPEHKHGPKWKKQTKALGGTPEEFCSEFTSDGAAFLDSFRDPRNWLYFLGATGVSWWYWPVAGAVLTAVGAIWTLVLASWSRSPLTAREMTAIENAALLKD